MLKLRNLNCEIKTKTNYKLNQMTGLNNLVGGFNEGELVTIAARVGCGKTSLALNILADFSLKGECIFVSLEMTVSEIYNRLKKSGLEYNANNIWIIESYENLEEIEEILKNMSCKFFFMDYIQLMPGSIKQNSRWLKKIALDYRLVVFAMSQLNRLAATSEPKLEMISTSDKIAHDSDQIWLITAKKIIIAKNRKGKTGNIYVQFRKEKFTFVEDNTYLNTYNNFVKTCNNLAGLNKWNTLKVYIETIKDFDKDLYETCLSWYKEKHKEYRKETLGAILGWKLWKF